MTPGKKRQAQYRARMISEGRRQYAFWLTEEQAAEIRAYLAGEASLLTPTKVQEAAEMSPVVEEPKRPKATQEKAAAESEPETKTKLVKVEPAKPERVSEYLVMKDGKQIGRVWQVKEKPKWRGFPSGFNERQYSGATKKAVVERIERYKGV